MKEVHCRRCGGVLTSPRSVNHRTGPIGQRCWREERGLPPLPYQRKSAIDEVPFKDSGYYRIDNYTTDNQGDIFRQAQLTEF